MDAATLLDALMPERHRYVELVRRRVATDADAEDVVQRALLRAWTRAGTLDDPARAQAWFLRILRRGIIDHYRARAAQPIVGSEAAADVADEQSEAPTHTPCACAMRLLGEIRPAYADILLRIDVEGHDPAVVARELGIEVNNLRVRLHRARRILRDEVRHHCGVEDGRPCLDCTCDANRRCSGRVVDAR